MASLMSSSCGGSRSRWRYARQWYGHAAGIFLFWTRLAAPWAAAAVWFSGSLLPLLVAPATACIYAGGYVAVRPCWRVPLNRLKAVDTALLAGAAAGGALLAGGGGWAWLPAVGLFGSAWFVNWWHRASAGAPGEGNLPVPPAFRAPVTGPVTAGYRSYDQSHTGVDFGVAEGTPILAPAPGRVTHAGPLEQWGYAVCLDHGDGWTTLFAHLEAPAVPRGGLVAAGDLVGWSGTSGISTGPHVHVELRYQGVPVDPEGLIA